MKFKTTRAATGDRGPPDGAELMAVGILTAEQLGPKMHRMPNGNLLCRDVPIARVGTMVYTAGETPIEVGPQGLAFVERTAEELFRPETIGSFMAAATTDEHPPDDVVPSNWGRYAKGFATTNVRRGTGDDSDVLLADLVITDEALIRSVLAGKREVSCGYDADYRQTAPGVGVQTNITGNHIALVRKGRCGPRCAIGDSAPTTNPEGNDTMTERKQLKARRATLNAADVEAARQRVADAQADLDDLEAGERGDDDGAGATHIHIHAGGEASPPPAAKAKTEDRIGAVEAKVTELGDSVKELIELVKNPAKTADALAAELAAQQTADAIAAAAARGSAGDDLDPKTGKAHDSAALATGYAEVLAKAEVLMPGFRMPTFDAALARAATVDRMCQARRKCLDAVYATKDGQELIDGVGGTKDLDLAKLDCKDAALLFQAAAGARAMLNNRAAAKDSKSAAEQAAAVPKGLPSIAEINASHKAYWANVNTPQTLSQG